MKMDHMHMFICLLIKGLQVKLFSSLNCYIIGCILGLSAIERTLTMSSVVEHNFALSSVVEQQPKY